MLVGLAYWMYLLVDGFATHRKLQLPGTRFCVLASLLLAITAWQIYSDRRRRAGTWYAVTDRRILFVLTTVWPQSVSAVEFGDIAEVSLNRGLHEVAKPTGVILKLKGIDPYLANSDVLGYQVSAKTIVLEDMDSPQGFYDQVLAAQLAAAAQRGESGRSE
jgi:hypothetical protein